MVSRRAVRFFRSRPFHFETLRALWYAPVGGADVSEVLSVVAQVRDGDFESWFAGWSALARAVHERAERLADPVSRGWAFLRASNYMRTAEFFLAPSDERRPEAADFTRSAFYAGLGARGVEFARSMVSFEGAEMETIFLAARGERRGEVLVVHGGFDSTPEELYFTVGAAGTERGFDVVIWEGPGQGNMLRRYGRTFVAEWERPAGAVLDWLQTVRDPSAIVGVGVSLGGHLLARAAAFEPRYDAIVLFDFFPGVLQAFEAKVPPALRGAFRRTPAWMEHLVGFWGRMDPELRWAVANGRWTFGADDLAGLVRATAAFDDSDWVGRIAADVLVLVGEAEHFFPKQLAHDFADRLTAAHSWRLREFTRAEAGHLHCQNGALHLAHEEIFDWIDDTTSRLYTTSPHAIAGPYAAASRSMQAPVVGL